jgi:MFS family permease
VRELVAVLKRDRRFLAFLIPAVSVTGLGAISIFLIPTALRSGLPDVYVGYFAVTASISSVVGPPICGWLADHWGRGRTAFAGALVAAGGLVAFGRVTSGSGFLIAYGIATLGSSWIYSMIYLAVLDLSPSGHRATYVAVRYGVQGLVAAPLYPLAGYAMGHVGVQWVFYAGAASCVFTGLMMVQVAGDKARTGDTA